MVSPPNKTVSDTMGPAAASSANPDHPVDPMMHVADEDVDVVLDCNVDDVEAVISDTFLINVVDN